MREDTRTSRKKNGSVESLKPTMPDCRELTELDKVVDGPQTSVDALNQVARQHHQRHAELQQQYNSIVVWIRNPTTQVMK